MLTKWRTCKEKEDVTLESRKKVEWVGLGLNHVQLCMLLSFQYHPICTQFARLDVHLPLFVGHGASITLIQPVCFLFQRKVPIFDIFPECLRGHNVA